jgi:hypothetical protein
MAAPDQPGERRHRVRSRLRRVAVVLAVVVACFGLASARLFVWPATGMPAHVDAIVVLGGQGDRLGKGLALARQGRTPVLVVSRGLPAPVPASVCAPRSQSFTVICFQPEPGTTQGEAEFVGHLAKQYGWHSVALVTTPDQDTRARIRFGRCFAGHLYVVTAPLPASSWPYEIVYQWGALFKALTLQRGCLSPTLVVGAALVLIVRTLLPLLPAHDAPLVAQHEIPRTMVDVRGEVIILIERYMVADHGPLIRAP